MDRERPRAQSREKQIPEKNEVNERSYSNLINRKRVSKKAIENRKHHKSPITIVNGSKNLPKNVKFKKFALAPSIFLDCAFL